MIVYDIEILKAVPPRNGQREIGVEYCEGWEDHAHMGISTICVYDYETCRYRVFCHDNFQEFQALVHEHQRRGIVSFNGVQFDDKVCWHNGLKVESTYDILRELWVSAGLPPTFQGASHKGFGLDACAKVNFGLGKTGYGGDAPAQWQQGQIGKVVDYCLEDVRLTKLLLDKIENDHVLLDPRQNDQTTLAMPKPSSWRPTY